MLNPNILMYLFVGTTVVGGSAAGYHLLINKDQDPSLQGVVIGESNTQDLSNISSKQEEAKITLNSKKLSLKQLQADVEALRAEELSLGQSIVSFGEWTKSEVVDKEALREAGEKEKEVKKKHEAQTNKVAQDTETTKNKQKERDAINEKYEAQKQKESEQRKKLEPIEASKNTAQNTFDSASQKKIAADVEIASKKTSLKLSQTNLQESIKKLFTSSISKIFSSIEGESLKELWSQFTIHVTAFESSFDELKTTQEKNKGVYKEYDDATQKLLAELGPFSEAKLRFADDVNQTEIFKNQLTSLNSDLQKLQTELEKEQKVLEDLDNKLKEAELIVKNQTTIVAFYSSSTEELNQKKEELAKLQMNAESNTVTNKQKETDLLKEQIARLETLIVLSATKNVGSETTEDLSEMQASVAEKQKSIIEKNKQITLMQSEISHLDSDLQQLTAQLGKFQKETTEQA